MILNICDMPQVMQVLRIINIVISIIRIVVPIILIVSAMIDFVRAVTNAELNKITKPMVSKVISAVIIFLIPTFVSVIALIAGNNGEYKHCLDDITLDQINIAFNEFENDLVEKVEESLNIYDYNNAMVYLVNIKDPEKRKEFEERLKAVKEQIDALNQHNNLPGANSNGYPTQTYGKCTFEQHNLNGMTYGLCVPENYKNESIPLIVWLHGAGERGSSFSWFKKSGLLGVVENWSQYGLKDIPAIIVAPQMPSGSNWNVEKNKANAKAVVEEVMSKYNINKGNVALIGHSLGGSGVVYMGKYMQSFSTITMLSGYESNIKGAEEYFKKTPVRGYSESGTPLTMTRAFVRNCGQPDNVWQLGVGHGGVPKAALTKDDDKDGYSDLIYWMLSHGGTGGAVTIDDPGTSGTPKIDGTTTPECNKNGKYQSCAPEKGPFGSFAYYDSQPDSTTNRSSLEMDPAWKSANIITVSKTCSNGKEMKWQVHARAKTIWETVQNKICEITTKGIDGITYDKDDIRISPTLEIRFVKNSKKISNHAYGLAIDINPYNKYTIDGKEYQPYNTDISQYKGFTQALGGEKDTRNINYVLWVKIFKPLGFEWGGTWTGSDFDGMHFQIDYKKAK